MAELKNFCESEWMVMNTIQSKRDLQKWLEYEKVKYGVSCNVFLQAMKYLCGSESAVIWHMQKLLRTEEYCLNTSKKVRYLLIKIRLNRLSNRYCIHIPPNVCGKGLHIMHLGPILINSCAIIGEDAAIHINTAVVAGGVDGSAPNIGNGVVFGVGTTVLGGISIADNIAIGANSVVNKTFCEENIAIAGSPAKKISNNGRLTWNRDRKNDETILD